LGYFREDKRWLPMGTMASRLEDWFFRIRDITLSFLALLLLSPLTAMLAFLVKISSPGPVFYKTPVVGKGNRQFMWRKFRSMKIVPDEEDSKKREQRFQQYAEGRESAKSLNASTKIIDESRVTSVGRFIRKYSLDELPQLWNVLCGQMSLVGPRPCLPYEANSFKGWRERRFDIRPGLTGVWQVFGRGKVSFEETVAMDVYYTYLRSFGFDLYLILKTLGVVLTGKGAR
jgi:undecaprenyl-phosphate galactose phosphotransferase